MLLTTFRLAYSDVRKGRPRKYGTSCEEVFIFKARHCFPRLMILYFKSPILWLWYCGTCLYWSRITIKLLATQSSWGCLICWIKKVWSVRSNSLNPLFTVCCSEHIVWPCICRMIHNSFLYVGAKGMQTDRHKSYSNKPFVTVSEKSSKYLLVDVVLLCSWTARGNNHVQHVIKTSYSVQFSILSLFWCS